MQHLYGSASKPACSMQFFALEKNLEMSSASPPHLRRDPPQHASQLQTLIASLLPQHIHKCTSLLIRKSPEGPLGGSLLGCCRPRVMQGFPACCRPLPTAASPQRYNNRRQSHDSGGWLCLEVPRDIMSTHPMHFSGWPFQKTVSDCMSVTILSVVYISLAGHLQQLGHVLV